MLLTIAAFDKRRSPLPRVVTAVGRFDFDYPRAEIAEHHCRMRTGERARQVDDQDSIERTVHHHILREGRAQLSRRSRTLPMTATASPAELTTSSLSKLRSKNT